LDLTGSIPTTDVGLRHFTENCPRLHTVVLARCSISDEVLISTLVPNQQGVRALVETNPRIKRINLRHCKKITDEAVRHVVEQCLELEELFLGFTAITDASLEYLARRPVAIEIDQCHKCSQHRFGTFLSTELH
jgi:hypothetical protein